MFGHRMAAMVVAPVALIAASAWAHHSVTANFDTSRTVEIRGEVVDVKIRSPHSSLVVDGYAYENDVRQGDKPERWEIESSAASGLRSRGITQNTIKAGDQIIVIGSPHKNPELHRLNSANFLTANREPFGGPRSGRGRAGGAAAPSADAVGVYRVAGRWRPPFQPEGDESALPLNEAGLQAWRAYDQKLSPANTCEPMNIPVVFNAPGYYVDIRFGDGNVKVRNQAYDVDRTIPMDGSRAPADPKGQFGVVSGHIDGNTLVIESADFPPSRWGLGAATQINGGGADVPSSNQKKITERFSVSDDGRTLIYEYTLYDPVYMREPHNARIELARVADDAFWEPYNCNVASASMFSRDPGDSLLDRN